jgi:hypothetical protein
MAFHGLQSAGTSSSSIICSSFEMQS